MNSIDWLPITCYIILISKKLTNSKISPGYPDENLNSNKQERAIKILLGNSTSALIVCRAVLHKRHKSFKKKRTLDLFYHELFTYLPQKSWN